MIRCLFTVSALHVMGFNLIHLISTRQDNCSRIKVDKSEVLYKFHVKTMKSAFLVFAMAVFSDCYSASEVENVFTEHQVVPDTLRVAPKKIVNVKFVPP